MVDGFIDPCLFKVGSCVPLSDVIRPVVRSFASLTGSIEDAARVGPCAHMVMSDVVRPSFEANRGRVRAAYKRSLDTRNAYGLMIFL